MEGTTWVYEKSNDRMELSFGAIDFTLRFFETGGEYVVMGEYLYKHPDVKFDDEDDELQSGKLDGKTMMVAMRAGDLVDAIYFTKQ